MVLADPQDKPWPERFLIALEASGNVSAAARAAGIHRSTAYERRQADPAFAAAWDQALEVATDALEAEARRRAHDGWLEPVFHQGEECGHVRKFDSGLLTFLLRAHRPAKFRDNHKVEHSGDLTIRVEYADSEPDFTATASRTVEDPEGRATV